MLCSSTTLSPRKKRKKPSFLSTVRKSWVSKTQGFNPKKLYENYGGLLAVCRFFVDFFRKMKNFVSFFVKTLENVRKKYYN